MGLAHRHQCVLIAVNDQHRRGLVAQLTEFVAAVREGRPPTLPPESAREDLALVLAAYRSLDLGAPVAVEV